jgi:hypothetical protein
LARANPKATSEPYDSKLFQPALMRGADARARLEDLRVRSAALDTSLTIDGEKGVIAVSQTSK